MRASGVLLAALIAVAVVLAWGVGYAAPEGFVQQVAAEITTIETDVRTGVLPAVAGILAALVLLAVGFNVVKFFTSGR